MADTRIQRSTLETSKNTEEDLPLPPPPPDAFRLSAELSGSLESCAQPLPPPKESFSKFYEQRQVNELKRLYRHMHPELRKNLEEAVTHDLAEILTPDEGHQQSAASVDPVVPGEVQSMRWIFENWTLDSIGEHQGLKKLTDDESLPSGNVKDTSLQFQSLPSASNISVSTTAAENDSAKGDVHTALWLFETQPLDSLNKLHQPESDLQEAILREHVEGIDVGGTKHLFETCSLDEIGRCKSVEEQSLLHLKSEIQESKGDVEKTVRLFQTEPLCAIRDKTGNIHEIKSICREDIQSNDVKSVRWLFETQPLDTINKDTSSVQLIRGISLEEAEKGGVNAAKWIFETQPLDSIKEHIDEGDFQASTENVLGADVSKHRLLFESQPLDSLKGNESDSFAPKEDVMGGDVKSTLWLFETQPATSHKNHFEVGRLQKVERLEEEKGDVKQRKHVFETCSISNIAKAFTAGQSTANDKQDVIKGDVKCFKNLFETLPLDSIASFEKDAGMQQEEVIAGNVKASQHLFETTPLYAIKDSSGNFHEVTSVSREQVMSGDVKNYKWMFETKPLDQFDESATKVDIIRGITKEEVMAGNVGTAKWLFETQPIDVIHHRMSETEVHASTKTEAAQKGDVKKCKWLFETQPVDMLYDRADTKQETEPVPQADVKSYTWMFETQPLDSLNETGEQYLKVSTTNQEDLSAVDVKTTKHVFETETLVNNQNREETKRIIRYLSRVEMPSGEVSRVKEMFETKPLSRKTSTSNVNVTDMAANENIQAGCVNKFTWMFENCPMDSMADNAEGLQGVPPEKDVKGGDVGGKRFVFETCSLDKIHEGADEMEIKEIEEGATIKGAVKSSTMLFETMPLYAIQDKEGAYHEVTSVKKEEIMKGDVRGAKWLFETKPLDSIKTGEEVFVIRAVTQEDVQKGDVRAARWRFETEPLDSISEERKTLARTVDDIQKGDVKSNKQLFESQQVGQKKYIRMVSVSDVQQGNVRTSSWLFENQPIDSLKGAAEEKPLLTTVQREDIQKGDVKRSTWLFETQPMDRLKDSGDVSTAEAQEVIPKADVKSTTWLFESTPLDKFDSKQKTETETIERNVKSTLEALFACRAIQHSGIIIEGHEAENVKMAKYQLTSKQAIEIQKEETVGGNLKLILQQLLYRTNVLPQATLIQENEKGELQITTLQLLTQRELSFKKEETANDVSKALQILLNQNLSIKKGLVMQETEGMIKIAIYSLAHHFAFGNDHEEVVKGDVKSTIGNLLASTQEQKRTSTVAREDNERGNVQLYATCIEKGDLGYLKSLQQDEEMNLIDFSQDAIHEGTHRDAEMNKTCIEHEMGNSIVTVPEPVPVDIREVKRLVTPDHQAKCSIANVDVVDAIPTTCTTQTPSQCMLGKKMEGNVSCDMKTRNLPNEVSKKESTKVEIKINASKNVSEIKSVAKSTVLPKNVTFKGYPAMQTPSPVLEASCSTRAVEDPVGNELQTALQNLRQATAEAESIQKKVQSKLHKSSEEIHLSSQQVTGNHGKVTFTTAPSSQQVCTTSKQQTRTVGTVQETHKSHSSLQKVTTSTKKVSATAEELGQQQGRACQQSQRAPSASHRIKDGVYTAKSVKSFYNPFIEADYNAMSVQGEVEQEEVVRGDVKGAIRALQSASTEQKEVERENVVRGNLKAALHSLEKSNINISKGDFKAAMIYKNAARSYSACKQRNSDQVLTKESLPLAMSSSDNDFPPSSAAVMGTECGQPSAKLSENPIICAHSPESAPDLSMKTTQLTPENPDAVFSTASETVERSDPTSHMPTRALQNKPIPPPKPAHLIGNTDRLPCTDNVKDSASVPLVVPPKPARSNNRKPILPMNQTSLINPQVDSEGHSIHPPTSNCPKDQEKCISESKPAKNKTPLQIAEEKYKKEREGENKRVGSQENQHQEHRTPNNQIKDSDTSKASDKGNVFFSEPSSHIPEFQAGLLSDAEGPKPTDDVPYNFRTAFTHFEGQGSPQTSQVSVVKKGVTVTKDAHVIENKERMQGLDNYTRKESQEIAQTARKMKQERVFTGTTNCSQQFHEVDPTNQWSDGTQSSRPTVQVSMPQNVIPTVSQGTEKQIVVMREKQGRESEDERRNRLSVHKDEIVRGNVKAAMDIYENLRKQEELQKILSKVEEFEDETSKVDVRSLKGLFENVPSWVVKNPDVSHHLGQKILSTVACSPGTKKDSESVSSVELAFGDLEKASTEIIHLKEQTLARLLDIEEAIKKALYSVSNLKSESDIAGLSGLFKESLESAPSSSASNNIRKISIVSSKAKPGKGVQCSERNVQVITAGEKTSTTKQELEVHSIPQRGNSPVSPSFISIESAARRPVDSSDTSQCPSDPCSLFNFKNPLKNESIQDNLCVGPHHHEGCGVNKTHLVGGEKEEFPVFNQKQYAGRCTAEVPGQHNYSNSKFDGNTASDGSRGCHGNSKTGAYCDYKPSVSSSPLNSRRQKSILEIQTIPELPKVRGTTTVTEEYEEYDQFGNKLVTSKSSKTFTNKSESTTSSKFEAMSSAPTYAVIASPGLRRHIHNTGETFACNGGANEPGVVFVTFGNSSPAKK